jgi:hypothetical protein
MKLIILSLLFVPHLAWSQYEDYASYDSFTELDNRQKDWGLVFLPSFIYTSTSEANETTGATAIDYERTTLSYDVRIGYIFKSGFYFGCLYAGENSDVDNSLPETSRTSFGFSFGYIKWGFQAAATFYPYSRQEITSAPNIVQSYSKGTGFQVDVGYLYRLNDTFSVGPQLVYKSINYGEAISTTNAVTDANSAHNIFTPMLAVMINLYRG